MKKFVSLLTALVLVLSLTACGGTSSETSAPAEQPAGEETASSPFAGKTVSVMTPYMASVTTNQMVGYLETDLTAQGAQVNVIDTANDFAELASRIEDVTASGTDAIVLVSADPTQLENQLREAVGAGIPVFGVDSGYIDGMQVNATSDNHQMGQLIAG